MFGIRKKKRRKVLVVGLDCAEPSLVFERWRDRLPTLSRLMASGSYGPLRSSIPCITVPAWSSMTSGKDPGVLGIYGFRNRVDRTYDAYSIATGTSVHEPRIWDLLSTAGRSVCVVGVPQTYPVRPVSGYLVSGFLTPGTDRPFTHPASLKDEIRYVLSGREYDFDVRDFRTDDKHRVLRQVYDMTEKRFSVLQHLLTTKPWEFAMFVEMGVDRMHHAFWSNMDSTHRRHVPGNEFQHAIRDYYEYVDGKLGDLLDSIDPETVVIVVSDHGAKRLDGGICINEWLIREGYLVLRDLPPANEGPVPFERLPVDWSRTKAWGAGGYYGRIFLNIRGREPEGCVSAEDMEAFRDELAARLEEIPGSDGKPIDTVCYRPEHIYRKVNGIAPDLITYFGGLNWRSIGTFGHGSIHVGQNDTGPDDANHAEDGLIIYYDPLARLKGRVIEGAQLMDVAPTVLNLMNEPVPGDVQGTAIRP